MRIEYYFRWNQNVDHKIYIYYTKITQLLVLPNEKRHKTFCINLFIWRHFEHRIDYNLRAPWMLLFGFHFTWLNEISQKLDNQQFESRENKFFVYLSISLVFENTIKWNHIDNNSTWILLFVILLIFSSRACIFSTYIIP